MAQGGRRVTRRRFITMLRHEASWKPGQLRVQSRCPRIVRIGKKDESAPVSGKDGGKIGEYEDEPAKQKEVESR